MDSDIFSYKEIEYYVLIGLYNDYHCSAIIFLPIRISNIRLSIGIISFKEIYC